MVLSASIVFALGVVHLVYTFWGPNLMPRDPALQISMSQISPVITKEITMWRCWVGFNASHSMGLILFGLVFAFLALARRQLLFQSPFLLTVGVAMLGGLVVFCKVYFSVRHSQAFAFLWPALQVGCGANLERLHGILPDDRNAEQASGRQVDFFPLIVLMDLSAIS